MPQTFTAIATRSNGLPKIDAGWFNILRLAGVYLETALGAVIVAESTFTFANNASATNVTGFLFDSTVYKAVTVLVNYRRLTATNESVGVATIQCVYRELTSSWDIAGVSEVGDDSGLTFTITSAGQLKYASSNITGSGYSGASRARATGYGLAV